MEQGQRPGAERGTSEHRSDWPCLHAIRRTERIPFSGVAVPFVRVHTIRGACESASVIPACLRRFKLWNGTQRQRPARGRVCSWSLRSGVAAKRSGEQRIETPESGIVRGGSLRSNRRRHRRTGASRTSHPSIVTGAIDSQSADASFWLRCAACVTLDTRCLTASASEARPASAPCSHRDSSPVSEMECAGTE